MVENIMNFHINNREIGSHRPTYIIAELSANHNGDINNAIKLIHAAKESGADAIKLQTYTPDTMTLNCDNEHFKIKSGTVWDGITLYDLYKQAYTPWEWHERLQKEAHNLGLDFFSTPFDTTAVDFLETLNVPCYKIASFEVTDHILLKKVAHQGKPVIMSTGVTELEEIAESVKILKDNGVKELCILKCTSAYPAPIEDANLRTIKNISETFNCISGLSDHTLGTEVPIAAVCLGANVIEKHFTLSRSCGSPDDAFSLEPHEFRQMVDSIRTVEKAIGIVKYEKSKNEKKSNVFRRSLFSCKDIKKDELITPENIKSVRPGIGLHTRHYIDILGTRARIDIPFGTPLQWNLINNDSAMKILFLGYTNSPLIDFLKDDGNEVVTTEAKITLEYAKGFDFIVSYGYRYIVKNDIIVYFKNRIINLHISFLPYNRGSYPNLWSFFQNTPSGVTIHYMDIEIDTGDIIVQKKIDFNINTETFRSSYDKLHEEIQQLFKNNWNNIKKGICNRIVQDRNTGTIHTLKELPDLSKILTDGYDTIIHKGISNYNNIKDIIN